MLTNPPMLALIAAQVGHSWGLFIVVNDMPKYMNDVLRFSIKKNGLYSAMPYVLMWALSVLSGVLSDYLTKNGKLSITNARITFTAICKYSKLMNDFSIRKLTVNFFNNSRCWSSRMFSVGLIFGM